MHRGQEPPEPACGRLRCPIPAARGQRRRGGRDIHHDGPGHQGQCGPPLPTFWGTDAWARRSQPLCGRQGPPFHRPAIVRDGLPVGARQRQRGVQEERRVKSRSMAEDGAAGGRARLGIDPDHIIPKCRVQRPGGWPKTELPGCMAVRGCRGNRAPLVGAREGAEQRAAGGLPPLPLRGGEGSPARRAGDGCAHDIALDAGGLELPEGKPASADQRVGGRQLLVGLLEQAELSSGVARRGRLAPYAQAGDRQTLGPDRPHAGGDAQREGGQRLPRGGRGVLGRAVLQPRTEKADAVTGHRTLAPILVGVQGLFLPDELLPRLQSLGRVPLAIRQRRPGTPDGLRGQPQRGQPRDHGSAAQQQATAQEHPQAMQEAEIGANRHTLYYTRQDGVHAVD